MRARETELPTGTLEDFSSSRGSDFEPQKRARARRLGEDDRRDDRRDVERDIVLVHAAAMPPSRVDRVPNVSPRAPPNSTGGAPTSESAPGSRGKIRCPSRVAAESSSSSRGGGTPGSWNLGVAHSATHRKDQRNYVDVLFAEYSNLVAAAETGDIASLLNLMNDVYVPAPDASTAKIRDAQIRAAALAATRGGSASALRLMLDRGADLGLFEEGAEVRMTG